MNKSLFRSQESACWKEKALFFPSSNRWKRNKNRSQSVRKQEIKAHTRAVYIDKQTLLEQTIRPMTLPGRRQTGFDSGTTPYRPDDCAFMALPCYCVQSGCLVRAALARCRLDSKNLWVHFLEVLTTSRFSFYALKTHFSPLFSLFSPLPWIFPSTGAPSLFSFILFIQGFPARPS